MNRRVFLVHGFSAVLVGGLPTASPTSHLTAGTLSQARRLIGAPEAVGCSAQAKRVERLVIEHPGVYEDFLVDSRWRGGNRVKIRAGNVVVRNCEIRNSTGNGIGVFARNVVIDRCHIHHMLSGTFHDQDDAHGITGGWNQVTIRNCVIHHVSGDAVQFDPDRRTSGRVVIENCTFWTGPLPAGAARFHRGERPGENAIDTKTMPPNARAPRCELIVRNCYFHGWQQPGQIDLLAALNIKENVDAVIENCVFANNQVCFRLRGRTSRGFARVTIRNCAIYNSDVALRLEDDIEGVKVDGLLVGPGVGRLVHRVGRGRFRGFRLTGVRPAPPLEELLRKGFPR